ncbi:MAG: aspartate carbamoyltransferase regulatory subunit [Bacteroidales bacterium]|nr:aspartate carbamoyltransferase regulatory subunit [Bacteroidales bacterium]MBR4678503.1 aspartate carbamoyltransferase regulatory subunit [Bacteroidales bacterium]
MDKSELKVNAIKDGTVIDHIPAQDLFKVVKILKLESVENQVTFGTNLDSKKLGKKAIIKISDRFFEDSDIDKIALLAPNANLNIIKNYEVEEKRTVELPEKIKGICKCMNPKCITNAEPMQTKFTVVSKTPPALKCDYCGKVTDQEHFVII